MKVALPPLHERMDCSIRAGVVGLGGQSPFCRFFRRKFSPSGSPGMIILPAGGYVAFERTSSNPRSWWALRNTSRISVGISRITFWLCRYGTATTSVSAAMLPNVPSPIAMPFMLMGRLVLAIRAWAK